LDVGGEKIFVIDDTGSNVSDPKMCAAMAALVFQTAPGSTVVVTADQSRVFEHLAQRYGGHVRRCPMDPQSLMAAAATDGIAMAGDGTGNFVFPALHPAIDGLLALGKLLELLARQQRTLSEILADLPPFHTANLPVTGDWESKGRVMRCLNEHFAAFRHEMVDGIKVFLDDDEWVLIRPDADAPIFHVIAEGPSEAAAQELVADYGGLVRQLMRQPCGAATYTELDG
jgi:mannose-1-phosphate guanylyltransferase/phosphomannomutase